MTPGTGGGPHFCLPQILFLLWLKTPSKISEPYDNPFWEKSKRNKEEESEKNDVYSGHLVLWQRTQTDQTKISWWEAFKLDRNNCLIPKGYKNMELFQSPRWHLCASYLFRKRLCFWFKAKTCYKLAGNSGKQPRLFYLLLLGVFLHNMAFPQNWLYEEKVPASPPIGSI